MVSKILKRLARQGLLDSHRGTKGGYSLAKNPDDLTLVDMITALEGPIAMTQCVSLSENTCDKMDHCPMCNGWEKVNNVIVQALESMTLASMCEAFDRPMPVRMSSKEEKVTDEQETCFQLGVNVTPRDMIEIDKTEAVEY